MIVILNLTSQRQKERKKKNNQVIMGEVDDL